MISQHDRLEVPCVQEVQTSLDGLKDMSLTQDEYQTHTSHMVPSMSPIVPDVTSHGQQNQL